MTLAEQTGNRFVLGLGVSHAPMVAGVRQLDYSKPLSQMRAYLEAMSSSPYGAPPPAEQPPTLLAALGPKMLELSRDARRRRASVLDDARAHRGSPGDPRARQAALRRAEGRADDRRGGRTRAAASGAVRVYAGLPNYRNNWLRLGFSDDEIEQRRPTVHRRGRRVGRCRHGAQPRPGTPRRGRGPRVHPTAVGRGIRPARLERARSARAVSQSTFTSVTRIDRLLDASVELDDAFRRLGHGTGLPRSSAGRRATAGRGEAGSASSAAPPTS